MLNGTNTASGSSPSASRTGCSTEPQSSAISEHSSVKGTPSDIGEWLMSLQRAGPVNRTPAPESDKAPTTPEICGDQRSTAFARLSPDGFWAKTCQGYFQPTLDGTLEEFCETWPKQGMMMSGGWCTGLTIAAPLTGGSGSGLWPTPTKQDASNNAGPSQWGRNSDPLNVAVVRNWPTPQANKTTPNTTDPEDLVCADGSPWKPGAKPHDRRTGKPVTTALGDAVRTWPTPKGSPSGPDYARANRSDSGGDDLATAAARQAKGQLNPVWVAWLMGWPIGWESLDPLAELVWLDWSVDPADLEEAENWPTLTTGPIPRVATGVKDRVSRLKALGNGQVPQCAAAAWRILTEGIF